MAIDNKDRQEAVEVVRWLRWCQEGTDTEDRCWRCPFAGRNCTRELKEDAAELIERFVSEIKKCENATSVCGQVCNDTLKDAALVVTWLRNCCETGKQLKWCDECPCNDGKHNCMDYLQTLAAKVLEQLIKQS